MGLVNRLPLKADGLVVRAVGDEVVVYDSATLQTHALDVTAARVFELCDGTLTPAEIAAAVGGVDAEVLVARALVELGDNGLIQLGAAGFDRRALMKRAGLVGGAAVAASMVHSVLAPTVAAAQSGGGGGGGGGGGPVVPPAPVIGSVIINSPATVTFTQSGDGGSPITDYLYSVGGGAFVSAGVTVSPVIVPSANVGDVIRLKAVNSVGQSGESDPVAAVTVPSAPTITFVSRSGGVASVTVVAGSNGGSPITNFEAKINDGAFIALSPATIASLVNVPGVAAGDTIQLRALNSVGSGAASNAVTAVTVSTLAGTGATGSADSPAVPTFNDPRAVAVDGAGNVYVADTSNRKIRKITPAGVVSTLAGTGATGSADGAGGSATFNLPQGVAVDSAGNVYVADTYNNKIRKITPAGVASTLAGTGATGSADGAGGSATFNLPFGVAVDSSGNVYVGDTGNRKIRKITPAGVVSTLAGTGATGSADGAGGSATFNQPQKVAVDSSGNVYVADLNNRKIRKITPAGVVSTLAGTGATGVADGPGGSATFVFPSGVAVDSSGNVYVADGLKIRKITSAGVVSTLAGTGFIGSADGAGSSATFNNPSGVAVDSVGNVYVADRSNHKVRKIT